MGALAAAAFAAGLLGGVHCAGMCGGIVGSLALQSRGPLVGRQLAFNAGRILSYTVAGAAAGLLGAGLLLGGALLTVQAILFALANAVMVLLGLYVAGWGHVVLRIEGAGARIWKHIEPLARRMLPIDSTPRAFAAGLLWGWVPCGLVYSMLFLAVAGAGALEGALVMLAFGLGTLPNLLFAGLAAQKVFELRRHPGIRRAAGALIIALGIAGLARVPGIREAVLYGWSCLA